MKNTLKILLIIGVICGMTFLSSPVIFWSGGVTRHIMVTVRSEEGKLIGGAAVSLIRNEDRQLREVMGDVEFSKHLTWTKRRFVSDDTGSGVLQATFGAGGETGAFGKSGSFCVRGNLYVEHPDFEDIAVPLANFTGKTEFSLSKKDFAITVFLNEKKTEQVVPPNGP